MSIYKVIDANGKTINRIVWDGVSEIHIKNKLEKEDPDLSEESDEEVEEDGENSVTKL